MTETTKNSIISAVTSMLMLLGSIPMFGKILPADVVTSLTTQVSPVVAALGTIVAFVTYVYKLLPKSTASIVKGAAEIPEVHQIVTTRDVAAKVDHPAVVAP